MNFVNFGNADVVVVGGGPSGSFAAWTLAKLGAEVVVFEEHKEIGVPSHCAGHVSLDGLKRLGLNLPQKVFENKICGAVFYSPGGIEFRIRRGSPVTCVLDRELLDKHLAELAENSGAEYFTECRVNALLLKRGFISGVSVSKRGTKQTALSRIVIDAEGCSSTLVKKADLQALDRSMVVNAIQAEADKISDAEIDMVEVYLGRKYAPGFFAWVIPRKDGSAKVGLASKTGDPRLYFDQLIRKHPIASRKLRKSKFTSFSMHPISLGGAIPKTYANGLLVVGEAASQVKPTTGGGIIFGLICARIAGETAHEALQKGDFSEKFLSRYQARWRKTIGFELDVMRWLRKRAERLSDRQMDKLFSLASRLGAAKALEEAGDVDYEGSSLVRMLSYFSIPVLAFYFVLCSLFPSSNWRL